MVQPPTETLTQLIAAINAERKARALRPLLPDPTASDLAQEWAVHMSEYGMTHGAFGDRIQHSFPNKRAGEDIAAGQTTVAQVVQSWMDSPPHRANILGDFDLIGAGEAGTDKLYWCLDFIKE